MAYLFKTFIPATARPEISEAVEIVCGRHVNGEPTTSIVAPPRVGKSFIINSASIELVQNGHASFAIVLSPWELTAVQIVSKRVNDLVLKWYFGPGVINPLKVSRAQRIKKLSPSFFETTSIVHLWSCTIQLAKQLDGDILKDAVNRAIEYGERPIVFIDESQLVSENNTWGDLARTLENAGAHIVLLTGTPYRADKKLIPGFRVKEISREDGSYIKSTRIDDDYVRRETYDFVKINQKLIPDYEVTLRKAWQKGYLCKIEPMWVDSFVKVKDSDNGSCAIKDLPTSVQAKTRREATVNPFFVKESCRLALGDLALRRKSKKDSVVLVITASDNYNNLADYDDGFANKHARQFRREMLDQDPSLNVKIATQASDSASAKSEKAKRIIERFVDDSIKDGDVLIVKNMGTVGLDCKRIKTIVFAGTYRQAASWLQSILRGATVWDNMSHMTLILLEDAYNRSNWETLILSDGGNYDMVSSELIDSELVEKQREEYEENSYETIDARLSSVQDSHNDGSIDYDENFIIDRIMRKFPIYREKFSRVEISGLIKAGSITIPENDEQEEAQFIDTGKQCSELAADLEELAKEYANKGGTYYEDKEGWVSRKRDISKRAKRIGNLKCEPSAETDPARLKLAVNYVDSELDKLNKRAENDKV